MEKKMALLPSGRNSILLLNGGQGLEKKLILLPGKKRAVSLPKTGSAEAESDQNQDLRKAA